LQLQLFDTLSFFLAFHMHSFGFQCRLDRHRLQRPQHLGGDRGVDATTPESQAPRQTEHQIRPVAPIHRPPRRLACIDDGQPATTAPAGEKSRQQCPATASRLRTPNPAVCIRGQQCLVPLELRPPDIALVVILQQNLPLLKWFAVSVALAQVAIDDLGALLTFAIDIGPGVERVLQHREDVSVADSMPFQRGHRFAVGWSRKLNFLSAHRKQYLPRAAAFSELGKNEMNDFLNALVRIETKSHFAVPDIAQGYGNA